MRRSLSLIVLGLAGAAGSSGAQVTARAEGVVATGYLWRGLTRHRAPVAQLFGSASTTGTVDLEASAWASGVAGDCDRPVCPGGTGARLADVNGSLLARMGLGKYRMSLGANVYHFNAPPFAPTRGSATTWEVVASLYPIASRHLQLGLTAWYDVDKVNGLYMEGTGTLPFTLRQGRRPRMFLTATLGLSHNQTSGTAARPERGYFQKSGFTHLALELSQLVIRPDSLGKGRAVQLFVRVQGNFDGATKAPVWPFKRGGAEQQVIAGFAVHPIVRRGVRGADHR